MSRPKRRPKLRAQKRADFALPDPQASQLAAFPAMPVLPKALLGAAADLSDEETALQLAEQVVDALHDLDAGREAAALEAEIALSGTLVARAEKRLAALDFEIDAEPLEIPASRENGGKADPGEEVPPWRWALRDQVAGALCAAGFVVITTASFVGVQATLADSELPIFTRNPELPYFLAILAPAASVALKFVGNAFTRRAIRELFAKGVAVAGGLSFFVWIVLFAGLFEGLAGVFDPFAEPNHLLGWGFNLVHVVTEVLIGAALYLMLDRIMAKYTPSHDIPNPKRPPLIAERDATLALLEGLTVRHGTAAGELRVLDGERNLSHVAAKTGVLERRGRGQRDSILGA